MWFLGIQLIILKEIEESWFKIIDTLVAPRIPFSMALKKNILDRVTRLTEKIVYYSRRDSLRSSLSFVSFFMRPFRGTRGGREGVRVRTWRGLVGKPRRRVVLLIPGYHESSISTTGILHIFCIIHPPTTLLRLSPFNRPVEVEWTNTRYEICT